MKSFQSVFSQLAPVQVTAAKFAMLVVTVLSLVSFSANSHAEQVVPEQVVKNTVDAIVNNIQSNRAEYENDSAALHQMLEDTLVPALHVPRMSNLILGKKYSRLASDQQKEDFADVFKTFLMKSYAAALLEYTGDQKVVYQPVNAAPGADKVKVQADLISAGGATYPITLFMSNRKDTRWRAYNMDVAGINFILTYRATFGAILETKGIDGLIEDLRAKNARL